MARVEEAKINRLVNKIRKKTNVDLGVEETEYFNGYDSEYSYSVYIEADMFKFYLMESASGDAMLAYMDGILTGYEYAFKRQFKTICQN
jgi:hypothetical protein